MSTRERILDAAAQVMHDRGLAASTTREIARAAGYSEATLYKHFADKQEIFLSVLRERLPRLGDVDDLAGRHTVTANLELIVDRLLRFYARSFPIAASIFSQPELLASHRDSLAARGAGPRSPVDALVGYLDAERRQGRIPPETDVEAAAALLAGAAFQHAFFANFEGTARPDRALNPDGTPIPDETAAWAARLVAASGLDT
jgi:AcrR family transcriptional regulator